MSLLIRRALTVTLAVLALAVVSLPAAAQTADQAKACRTVAEQADGYLGVPPGAPPGGQAVASRINAQRKEHYATIAKKNGLNVAAVAQRAGQKLTAKTPSGRYFRNASGRWDKKP